jgi:hypothetical protein
VSKNLSKNNNKNRSKQGQSKVRVL